MSKFGYAALTVALAVGVAVIFADLRATSRFKYVVGPTSCMAPTIRSGELIFVKPFDHGRSELKRYEVVLFKAPMPVTPAAIWVMRVLGLPGEQVELRTSEVIINSVQLREDGMPDVLRGKQWLTVQGVLSPTNRMWTLGPDEVFVVGDNLAAANDSRFWGGLRMSNILGVVEEKAKGRQFNMTLDPVLPLRGTVTVQEGQKGKVN